VNGDCSVTGLDLAAIANGANFNKPVGDAANPCADANGDGFVTGLDLAFVSSGACFNTACTP
jgi:hypothetical protein